MKKLLLNRVNVLFLLLVAVLFLLPPRRAVDKPWAYLTVLILAEAIFLVQYSRKWEKSTLDVATVAFLFLGVWDVTSRLNLTHPVLIPPPENVFNVFITQRELMITSVFSSLRLLLISVAAALVLSIFLGLFVGWIPRLRSAVLPIVHIIGPIPPLVYTPYVVAVMPSFRAASLFVIFFAVFMPTFQNMITRVTSVDHKIIQSAKVMNVSTPTMLFRIILPYCMPSIISGLSGTFRIALLCLSGAELLGASSGLGYFVKRASDYANYTQVLAGIVLMGIVVSVINIIITLVQKKTIKWRYT